MITVWGTFRADDFDLSLWTTDDVTIHGFQGDDLLITGSGNDTLLGGYGNDRLEGGSGNDVLWGGNGPTEPYDDADYGVDVLIAGAGNDELHGQNGNDRMWGEAGDDMLDGGRGDDWIIGGLGVDTLFGGEGKDRFAFGREFTDLNGTVWRDSGFDPQTMDRVMDFITGYDQIEILDGPAPVDGVSYFEADMPGAYYWNMFDAARSIIGGGIDYAFLSDGNNGYLFWDANNDNAIDMGIMLMSLRNTGMFSADDIVPLTG